MLWAGPGVVSDEPHTQEAIRYQDRHVGVDWMGRSPVSAGWLPPMACLSRLSRWRSMTAVPARLSDLPCIHRLVDFGPPPEWLSVFLGIHVELAELVGSVSQVVCVA
jgi:hypothetical protein